jgi:glycosyltransferase involved in cell wall biosynthesis
MKAIDRAVARYCVYTTAELEAFPRLWGVDPAKMAFTPFYYHLSDEELEQPPVAGDAVFSGGDSLRDYETLIEVAAGMPEVPFHVASARYRPAAPPSNAQVGRIPHDEYIQRIRSAAVVVVPLRKGVVRTAGLETFLTAMALGKVIITTDSPGIRDYVDAGRTGLIVPPGDAGALREAIQWTVDPANAAEVARIAQAGRESARRDFSPEAFIASLLAVAEGPLAPLPQRPARPFGSPGERTV